MKILVITRYFPLEGFPSLIGGISFSLKSFHSTFIKKGHKISIFIIPDDIKANMTFPKGIHNSANFKPFLLKNCFKIIKDMIIFFKEIFRFEYKLKKKIREVLSKLRRISHLMKLINFSHIIQYYHKLYEYNVILAYDSTFPAQIGLIMKNIKNFIIISHGNDILKNNNAVTKMSLQKADKIIVRSRFIKNLVKRLYDINEKYIFQCPDGIILEDFDIIEEKTTIRKELNLSQNEFYILSIGALDNPRKGFDLVIKSIAELREKYNIDISKINYIILSRDDPHTKNKLIALAKKFKIDEKIKIKVNLNDDLRNKYYKASDLYVMPSKNLAHSGNIEGFGNVFIEAGFYSLPSIGSNTGGIPDAIEDGKSGFLINNNKELVEKIKLLYENKDLCIKMGNYAHKRVLKRFTWNKIYLEYLNAFNNDTNKKNNK